MSPSDTTPARARSLTIACLSALLLLACEARRSTAAPTIVEAQEALTDSVMALAGVAGTGIGECDGKPCITVMVERKTAELLARIPTSFRGFPVVIEEIGEISPQDEGGS